MNIKEHAKIVLGADNVQDLHDLRSALLKVMGGELTDKDFGICFNWNMLVTGPAYSYAAVLYFSKDWPQHNGPQDFPIKEDHHFLKWEGPSLAARQSLMLYILGKLDEHIPAYEAYSNRGSQ